MPVEVEDHAIKTEMILLAAYSALQLLPTDPDEAAVLVSHIRQEAPSPLKVGWQRRMVEDVRSVLPAQEDEREAVLSIISDTLERVVRPYQSAACHG